VKRTSWIDLLHGQPNISPLDFHASHSYYWVTNGVTSLRGQKINYSKFSLLKSHISNGAESPLRHHLELQESSKKPAKLTAWRVFCFLSLQRSPATSFDIPQMGAPHQRRGNPLQRGSTPKTGAIPFNGQFFRQGHE